MATSTSKKRSGRPPKYDWGDKREICHRLYVEEKKSADRIIKYFTEHFGVDAKELPCRRGFLRQFELWGFPPHRRKLTPGEESNVTARIRGLWERNISQKEIRQILVEDGFDIGKYEFRLLWKRNGFCLRSGHGYKAPGPPVHMRMETHDNHGEMSRPAEVVEAQSSADRPWQTAQQSQTECPGIEQTGPDGGTAVTRARRLFELQIESDQRLQMGKRRRRIRGLGPLPPDAPGLLPRYASETSLDECKAYLHLSNEMYTTIRADFETICSALGIVKKAQCAEGIWEEGKSRLIRENLHLTAMFHPLQSDQERKSLALDCICTDVTKRNRASTQIVTIADANNFLNLNPMESKAVRRSLYEILESHNFESRLLCGEEHWNRLRQEWFNTSKTLLLAVGAGDPMQLKSVDALCRDTLKRYRDDKVRRGERTAVREGSYHGPGPGPARPTSGPRSMKATSQKALNPLTQPEYPIKTPIREPRVKAAVKSKGYYAHPSGNLLMSLVQSTGNIDYDIDPALEVDTLPVVPDRPSMPISAYFSLAPGSHIIGNLPKVWPGELTSVTLESLHRAATGKLGAAQIAQVQGLIINDVGLEDNRLIASQADLAAYLQKSGERPKFSVLIQSGYA